MIRKNQNVDKSAKCSELAVGVDLNRNYGYKFGIDNEGSSPLPCAMDYRGKHPFSEPETQAVRNYISWHSLTKGSSS